MAEPHLDHPGEISWYKGEGPLPVLGPCPHDCKHLGQSVIGWGPSLDRYEIVECGILGCDDRCGSCCGGECRAWVDGRGVVVTAWLQVQRPATVDDRRTVTVSDGR